MKYKHTSVCFSVLITVLLVFFLIYSPWSVRRQRTSVCRLTADSWYELPLPTGDTLYLATQPSASYQVGAVADSVCGRVVQSAVWVSPVGHAVTSGQANGYVPSELQGEPLTHRLRKLDSLTERQLRDLQSEVRELDYYARRHSVVDDGYHAVMTYRTARQNRLHHLKTAHKLLQKALQYNGLRAHLSQRFSLTSAGDSYSLEALQAACTDSLLWLRTVSGILPQGATFVPLPLIPNTSGSGHLVACCTWGGSHYSDSARVIPLQAVSCLPSFEGGARWGKGGQFRGIQCGGDSQPLSVVGHRFGWAAPFAWLWAWQSVPYWSASSRPAVPSEMVDWDCLVRADSSVYIGQVRRDVRTGKTVREGWGTWKSPEGVCYEGQWHADTLASGRFTDAVMSYQGGLNARFLPSGSGRCRMADGEYYDGEWADGRRQGLGFSSRAHRLVHCGVWRKDRFRGERMIYTPDRVYGIDISRYQHEVKGRVYGIRWADLRITHLADDRRVRGKVDYPVSYVYIKSTQGDDIVNRYYQTDSRQARRHGLAVGSYHFFSTRMSGAVQAEYFLQKSVVAASDLPPMLDVEPSDRRVAEMGGDEELVRQLRIWLERVEQATGKRPVIYSYQKFIDDHLASSPDLLNDYPVWVARYGEYKPYYRLLHWQLSSSGRVRGIQGEVDINVFNGTAEHFREYREQVRISR